MGRGTQPNDARAQTAFDLPTMSWLISAAIAANRFVFVLNGDGYA
jgi:hypothetical protein